MEAQVYSRVHITHYGVLCYFSRDYLNFHYPKGVFLLNNILYFNLNWIVTGSINQGSWQYNIPLLKTMINNLILLEFQDSYIPKIVKYYVAFIILECSKRFLTLFLVRSLFILYKITQSYVYQVWITTATILPLLPYN